jgi:hypothetical protein
VLTHTYITGVSRAIGKQRIVSRKMWIRETTRLIYLTGNHIARLLKKNVIYTIAAPPNELMTGLR